MEARLADLLTAFKLPTISAELVDCVFRPDLGADSGSTRALIPE